MKRYSKFFIIIVKKNFIRLLQQRKINLNVLAAILMVLILASCNSGNHVVSSLGKRKYTKGWYSFLHFNSKHTNKNGVNSSIITTSTLKRSLDSNPIKSSDVVISTPSNKQLSYQTRQHKISNKKINVKVATPEVKHLFENVTSMEDMPPPYYPHYHSADLDRAMTWIAIICVLIVLLALLGLVFTIIGAFGGGGSIPLYWYSDSGDLWFPSINYLGCIIKYRGFNYP